MSNIWNRLSGRSCEHERTLIVSSVGVRRAVCENCGHISFEMEPLPQPTQTISEKSRLVKASGF